MAVDPLESILLGGPDKSIYVSSLLSSGEKEQIQQVLLGNMDVFAWTHSNLASINPVHASHKLNVIPSAKLVRQKMRRFHPDRHRVIQAEVDNLLKVGFIREIKYPEWLANVVVVPKKGGKWRVSVDYKILNKACPKRQLPSASDRSDCRCVGQTWDVIFPGRLLGISSNIHTSARRGKIVFITPHRLFCYNVMSFGLKNVGETYQRLVTKMFMPLLGKTMEVCIDDMLVKSKERLDHAKHLQEAFELLRGYGMKLNPSKGAFGVGSGRFLGFMVT